MKHISNFHEKQKKKMPSAENVAAYMYLKEKCQVGIHIYICIYTQDAEAYMHIGYIYKYI